MPGNKYTHHFNLVDIKLPRKPKDAGVLASEFTIDGFAGLMLGDFPFNKQSLYGGDVQNLEL